MYIWQRPWSLPAWPQSCEAWAAKGSRTVAMMRSSFVRSWRTNSRPMPLLAPRMSHVVKSSSAYKTLGIWFIRAVEVLAGSWAGK